MPNTNAFPPTKCWMMGFGPYCDVADVNTVGIQGEGAGSEGGDPNDGPGARDFYNCLRKAELDCVRELQSCIADEMLHYADAMSLKTSRGEKAEDAWTEQAYNAGFYNWFDQQNTRYISRVNARSNLYGVLGAPDYNSPNTAFIYHAAAKTACLARLRCDFRHCYCDWKRCVKCEDDGTFVNPNPNTGTPGNADPNETTFRNKTITTNPFKATRSIYGEVIPLVYGTGRVKGNVIWAGNALSKTVSFVSQRDKEVLTETVEVRTIDLAVGVSAGVIGAIGRIWLGDRVIYNAAYESGGASRNAILDFDPQEVGLENKTAKLNFPFSVTVYRGTEDQRPHNLQLDAGQVPIGYRGLAYVVFEHLPFVGAGELPDFTFEVVQTIDNVITPTDTGDLSAIPFDGLDDRILAYDEENNGFVTVGKAKTPLGRASIVKIAADTLAPSNILHPVNDAIDGFTPYNVDPLSVGVSDDGIVFFNDNGSTGYQKTLIFDSSAERTRRKFGTDSTVTPTGDYLRAFDGGNKSAFTLVMDSGGFTTRMGFFAVGNELQMLRYDLALKDYEVVKRTSFAGPIEALYAHTETFEDEIRRYLYVFYWTGATTAKTLTARVYRLQRTTDVTTYGFDPSALRFNEYVVNKSAWNGDDNVSIVSVMQDARDATLIVIMEGYVFKWKDGVTVWARKDARLPALTALGRGALPSISGTYRWLNGDGLYTLDLDNGAIDSVATGVSLPSIGAQFYDYRTDSVVFINGGAIQRFYANRVVKAATALSDVLVDLLRRGGLYVSDGSFAYIPTIITGYVIDQQVSARVVLEQFSQLFGLSIVEEDDGILITDNAASPVTAIDKGILGMRNDGTIQIKLIDDLKDYTKVTVTYYDSGQLGETHTVLFDSNTIVPSERNGAENILSFDFPVIMSESEALSFAERMMYRAIEYKAQATCTLPPSSMLDAGDGVQIDGITWRIRSTTYQTGLGKVVNLVADPLAVDASPPAIPSTGTTVPDDGVVAPSGSAEIQVFNVPSAYPAGAVGEDLLSSTFMFALASTPSAPVDVTYDDVYTGRKGTVTLSKAPVSGRAVNALPAITDSFGIDHTSSLVVTFDTAPDQSLFDGDAFVGYGTRLLIVGTELIKFNAVAWSVDGKTATFTELMRGRRNTDMYARSHEAGELVVLYEDDAVGNGYAGTDYSIMGTTRVINFTTTTRASRSWVGTLRSDVIIPPVLWRDDGPATLSTDKIVRFVAVNRYWNDGVLEDDRGDIIPVATNTHPTLTVRPSYGQLLIWILRAPYDETLFRANFVTSSLIYEEFPSNPYIAAVMVVGAQPGVPEMQALPRHFCYMAVIGPYTLSATEIPRGMVAYGTFGDSSLYERETTEALEKSAMQGAVIVNIDGYSRPY